MLCSLLNASRMGVQAARIPPLSLADSLFLVRKRIGETFLFLLPKKTVLTLVALLPGALLLLSSSCALDKSGKQDSRAVTDEAGRVVRIDGKIERVISLAPSITEIVYAIGAGDSLVGNTTYCDYPAQAKQVQKVGDTLQPNIERILALRPNLIIISTASQLEVFTRQLDEHNIPVYVSDPHNLEDVIQSIEKLGSLLSREDQALELGKQLRSRTTAIEQAVQGRQPIRTFYQLSAQPLYTAGRDAFVTDLIKRAGGLSVTEHVPEAWPKYSEESAVAARPETIILPTGGSMGEANSDVALGLKKSPAVLSGKVIRIDGDLLVRPGPRAIDGLEQLARALHPEAFK